MKLNKVEILKYKSFSDKQEFDLEDDITILVGMNESGKTAALEAIAKANYFREDDSFKFKADYDYPRREKKKMEKERRVPEAVSCTYEIDEELLTQIENDLGRKALKSDTFTIITKYDNSESFSGIPIDKKQFISNKTKDFGISSETINRKLERVKSLEELKALQAEHSSEEYKNALREFEKYFENKWNWDNDPIGEYVSRIYLKPNIPKFLYYDHYYTLPSRIDIEELDNYSDKPEYKTAKALFELADINTEEIIKTNDFERIISELEATQLTISEELFTYWSTNKNLEINFQIDIKKEESDSSYQHSNSHILDIRIKNIDKGVSLPLKNRSKGFNWFFSFLVWFKKIQEDRSSDYILLLDEPGLNLHASAQADLLRFLEDLSKDYQIIYTTHSPFMISSERLNRVRTVFETSKSSVISESIQQKDPDTLFPLQAALGYDIAQNLFISNKNLLVEGVSDLIVLTAISEILKKEEGRTPLAQDVTIVPTGGLERVASFISLLRGSELKVVCLLDSYSDPKGRDKMNGMIKKKIIHENRIRFFHEFIDGYNGADLEDLFSKKDYLKLFNAAFPDRDDISETDLNPQIQRIVIQINTYLEISRFNHYRPAKELIMSEAGESFLESNTLDNFENMFKKINEVFQLSDDNPTRPREVETAH